MTNTKNAGETAAGNRTPSPRSRASKVKSSYESIINASTPVYFGGKLNDKIQAHDSLIEEPHDDRPQCPNSMRHEDIWESIPEFAVVKANGEFDQLKNPYYWDDSRSFLFLLGKVCIDAKLKKCTHAPCCKTRREMDAYAPACGWVGFRNWALTAMSCQANFTPQQQETIAHAHLVNSVFAIYDQAKSLSERPSRLHDILGHSSKDYSRAVLGPTVEVADVCNVIFWMLDIQREMDLVPTDYKGWAHRFLSRRVIVPSIETALEDLRGMEICKQRVWNLINISERKQSELPTLIKTLKGSTIREAKHDLCSQTKCQLANIDTTKTEQLCKCGQQPCQQYNCPNQKVADEILSNERPSTDKITAWCTNDKSRLVYPAESYMAISLVWSDGTGVGRKSNGSVNGCLFNYFSRITDHLGCKGIWWDTLSIPSEPTVRTEALRNMHENYKRAQVTVVHDLFLLNREYNDPESACLALVLSPWFARGWTALELAKSNNVKVLFKGRTPAEPDIRDLDKEILARDPGHSSRTHWFATCAVTRLRQPLLNLIDILAVLRPRSTSWICDRTIIPSLLAEVSDRDFTRTESEMTQTLIKHYFDSIPHTALLHGCDTMTEYGGFSWCPTTLDDMPVDLQRTLDYDEWDPIGPTLVVEREDGSIMGTWYARPLSEADADMNTRTLKPFGKDLAAVTKIDVALHYWSHCLLLYHDLDSDGPGLLVIVIRENETVVRNHDCSDNDGANLGPVLDCQYVGAAIDFTSDTKADVTSGLSRGPGAFQTPFFPTWIRLGKVTSEEVSKRGHINAKSFFQINW